MALQTLVKISSVNNLSDARYVAGMGVDLMGFNLEKTSERYVAPEVFSAITSWISGVRFVGEVDQADDHRVAELAGNYELDYLQVCDATSMTGLTTDIPLIFKIDKVDPVYIEEVLNNFSSRAQWFLVEPPEPLTEQQLSSLDHHAKHFPLILGSNVSVENLTPLMEAGYRGFALRGGQEIKPGYKDFDELAEVLEALEVED